VQPRCYLLEDTTLISRVALSEHRVRLSRNANRTNVRARRGLFSLLEFDVIRHNNVCKESLNLIDREEATRADRGI
jgi:hypothetical protein